MGNTLMGYVSQNVVIKNTDNFHSIKGLAGEFKSLRKISRVFFYETWPSALLEIFK